MWLRKCGDWFMGKHTKVIDGSISIKPALDWAYSLIMKGLEGGPVAIDVYRYEEIRSNAANAKQWCLYSDLSKQLQWYGETLTEEHWKELLSNEWQAQKIVPGVSGGFCALGVRTSKMKKREMSELIEIIYAFGAERGVKWSDPSLAAFAEYREAQA